VINLDKNENSLFSKRTTPSLIFGLIFFVIGVFTAAEGNQIGIGIMAGAVAFSARRMITSPESVKWWFWVALISVIGGIWLAYESSYTYVGSGFIGAGIIIFINVISCAWNLFLNKMQKAEDRIKELEEEIKFLKNK